MTWSVRLNWVPAVGSVASSSQYMIDRETADGVFTESQAVTATKSGPVTPFELAAEVTFGATEIPLVSISGMTDSANTNAAILEDAFVRWTAIDVGGKKLTGVTWLSGYGTYLAGTALLWACETVDKTSDESNEPTAKTIWFRIRHTLSGKTSAPAFLPVFFPPAPASRDHCVVAIGVLQDLGVAGKMLALPTVAIKVTLEAAEFSTSGLLVKPESTSDQVAPGPIDNTYTTGAAYSGDGYIFAQCLKDSARVALTGAKSQYVADIGGKTFKFAVPDMDFVTLLAILTAG